MEHNYKFQVLESLRGYMAWWVVFGHALQLTGFRTAEDVKNFFGNSEWYSSLLIKPLSFFLHDGSAVNVFIILSGFVISHLLIVKNESYLDFICRRFFRLAPALYVSLIFAISFLNLYEIAFTELTFSTNVAMRESRILEQENNFFLHLFTHLTLTHSFFPQEIIPFSPTTFLAPAWSIGLEWQFYLIAPFLLFYLKRSQNAVILTVFLLMVIRYAIQHFSGLSWQHNSFFFNMPDYFLVGILSRLIIERLRNKIQIADISILLVILLMRQDSYSTFIWLVVSGIVFYEIKYLHFESDLLKKVLNVLFFNKVATNIGKWSYSTYLIHIPIFSLFVGGFANLIGPQAVSRSTALVVLILSIPVILGLSALMYRYVELPSMEYISSKLKQKKVGNSD